MSFAALAWAAKQRTGKMAAKNALLALANWADEEGCAYPSTAAIAEFGDMDHKTATAALDHLARMGLIEDTGRRAGHTRQIKIYRLAIESIPEAEAFQKRKPSASSAKAPQKRGTDTVRTLNPQKTSSSSERRVPVRGTRITTDWMPKLPLPPNVSRLIVHWPPGRLEVLTDEFRDFWLSATKNPTKADWDRAFHNRLRALALAQHFEKEDNRASNRHLGRSARADSPFDAYAAAHLRDSASG
jgi:hypothetical protein